MLTDRIFVGAALVGGMQCSGLFAYLSTSSFLFQEVYALSPQQYGLLFAMNSLGIIIGSQTAARVMRRTGPQWILAVTTAVQCAAGLAILALGLAQAPLWALLIRSSASSRQPASASRPSRCSASCTTARRPAPPPACSAR